MFKASDLVHHAYARRWQWVGAAGAVLALVAYWSTPDAPPASALARPAPVAVDVAIGPGLLRDTAFEPPIGDIGTNGALEMTPDGRLLPNAALHDVLDYFLLARADEAAKAALRAYLSRKISPAAVADAMQIADDYVSYIKEHDALLAAQNLPLPSANVTAADLARLSTWCAQRERLRERRLGKQVVQAWYQDEDLQTGQAIDELQRSDEDPAAVQAQQAAQDGITPFRPVPHWSNPADAERHRRYLLDVLTRARSPASTR